MSVYVKFDCLVHNETARKAMENYVGILQEAFEHYRNLWDNYIKLQEKHEQCNVHSSSQVIIDTTSKEIKKKHTPQECNSRVIKQDGNNISLWESDTLNIDSISFNSNVEAGLSHFDKSLHKDTNNPPKSPVFHRTYVRTSNAPSRKIIYSNKATPMYDNLIPDIKTHHNTEKVPSECQKLGISTSQHVETTFLPSGKRLKQSRLIFHSTKSNEKTSSLDTDKYKPVDVLSNVEQDVVEHISVAKASVTVENNATNTDESFGDVIEISPTQRHVKSKARHCLKLKRNIPATPMTESPIKNKCHSPSPGTIPEITIDDMDFVLHPSPEHNSKHIKDDKSLIKDFNTVINTLKGKVNTNIFSSIKTYSKTNPTINLIEEQSIVKKKNINVNDLVCQDEIFYLPAEKIANNMDNINLDDTENIPPVKKMLLDKFDVAPKRKGDISEHLNMRCKADRAKLDGRDCWECKEYFKNLSLSKEELQKRKNQCSRHRYKYERPKTPEGFWDPEFPETLSSTYRQDKN